MADLATRMAAIELLCIVAILILVIMLVAIVLLKKKKSVPPNIEPEVGKNEKSTINTHMTDKLMESKNLLDRGIITEEEFEEMKKDIMGK